MFKIIIILIVTAFLPLDVFTQIFVAGQTTGGNIIHNDFSDINLSAFSWGTQDDVSLDLNGDNSDDIYF